MLHSRQVPSDSDNGIYVGDSFSVISVREFQQLDRLLSIVTERFVSLAAADPSRESLVGKKATSLGQISSDSEESCLCMHHIHLPVADPVLHAGVTHACHKSVLHANDLATHVSSRYCSMLLLVL